MTKAWRPAAPGMRRAPRPCSNRPSATSPLRPMRGSNLAMRSWRSGSSTPPRARSAKRFASPRPMTMRGSGRRSSPSGGARSTAPARWSPPLRRPTPTPTSCGNGLPPFVPSPAGHWTSTPAPPASRAASPTGASSTSSSAIGSTVARGLPAGSRPHAASVAATSMAKLRGETPVGAGGSVYLLAGGTPGADFRPRWQVGAGGRARVSGGATPTVLTLDLRHASYRSGKTTLINPGIEQYLFGGQGVAHAPVDQPRRQRRPAQRRPRADRRPGQRPPAPVRRGGQCPRCRPGHRQPHAQPVRRRVGRDWMIGSPCGSACRATGLRSGPPAPG